MRVAHNEVALLAAIHEPHGATLASDVLAKLANGFSVRLNCHVHHLGRLERRLGCAVLGRGVDQVGPVLHGVGQQVGVQLLAAALEFLECALASQSALDLGAHELAVLFAHTVERHVELVLPDLAGIAVDQPALLCNVEHVLVELVELHQRVCVSLGPVGGRRAVALGVWLCERALCQRLAGVDVAARE